MSGRCACCAVLMCRSAWVSRRSCQLGFHHRSEVGGQSWIIQPRRGLQYLLQVGDIEARKDILGRNVGRCLGVPAHMAVSLIDLSGTFLRSKFTGEFEWAPTAFSRDLFTAANTVTRSLTRPALLSPSSHQIVSFHWSTCHTGGHMTGGQVECQPRVDIQSVSWSKSTPPLQQESYLY